MAKKVRKKQSAVKPKIQINEHCLIWRRGKTWQFQMYITSQRKYDRVSLQTHDEDVARERAIERYGRNYYLINSGMEVFSLTLGKAADLYLENRREDIYVAVGDPNMPVVGTIGEERWITIRNQLKPFLDIHGRDVSLSSISPAAGGSYVRERIGRRGKSMQVSTLRNEQATINAMFKWLRNNNYTQFEGLQFPKLKSDTEDDNIEKKDTFNKGEVRDLQKALWGVLETKLSSLVTIPEKRNYVMACYFLLALQTGLRPGEQKQLKWRYVTQDFSPVAPLNEEVRRHDYSEEDPDSVNQLEIVLLKILASTSKRNRTRLVATSQLPVIELLENFHKHQIKCDPMEKGSKKNSLQILNERYVFSVDGSTILTNGQLGEFLKAMLERADIRKGNRKLTPYKCRHYYITELVSRGLTAEQIAGIVGTSISEIEKTYFRQRKEDAYEAAVFGMTMESGVWVPNPKQRS